MDAMNDTGTVLTVSFLRAQPDLVCNPDRDDVRQPSEATVGRNALLLRLGLPADVCRDVLNPGGHPRVYLRAAVPTHVQPGCHRNIVAGIPSSLPPQYD